MFRANDTITFTREAASWVDSGYLVNLFGYASSSSGLTLWVDFQSLRVAAIAVCTIVSL